MKSISLLIFLTVILPNFCFSQDNFKETKNSLSSDLGFTIGYVTGQKLIAENFSNKFPELSSDFQKSISLWEYNFKSSVDSIISEFPADFISNLTKKCEVNLTEQMPPENYTKDNALEYLELIKKRADGKMESPIIETLLTYNPDFKKNPVEELIRGYKKFYSTKDKIDKSKGILIKIELPQSWNIRGTALEDIVEGFSSENGRGNVSVALIVKDLSDEIKSNKFKLNYSFINEYVFSDSHIKGNYLKMFGKNARQIKREKNFISNHETLSLQYIGELQSLDRDVTVFQHSYIVPLGKKFFILSCTVAKSLNENEQDFKHRIELNDKLFKMIAWNCIVE